MRLGILTQLDAGGTEVLNTAEVDLDNIPPHMSDWVIKAGTSIGMVADGVGGFKLPERIAPKVLQAYQFHTMIEEIGQDQAIRQAIAFAYSGTAYRVAMNKLERTATFHRNDPLVEGLARAVGLTSEDVDILWLQATGL